MARLIGAQRMVLQAILNLPKDAADNVTDLQIAQTTQIALGDVRDWLETLEGDGNVNVVKTTLGLTASITAHGKLALGQYRPFLPTGSEAGPVQTAATSPIPTHASSSSTIGTTVHPTVGEPVTRQPVEVFYSYSHKDEALRDELEEALALLKRQGQIAGWHDRGITPGQEWADQISEHLESAKIILLLVSSSFLASDYCYGKEMGRALERHDNKEAVVIPVIVRDCDWHEASFAKLQALPKNAKPVMSWPIRDEAWTDVARGIRRAVEAMTASHR